MLAHDTRRLTSPRWIINIPTKRHWRGRSRIEDIESGLEALIETIGEHGIRSVAIPPLGCGLGGLNWLDVKPLIEKAMVGLPEVAAFIYEPGGTSAAGTSND
jgi:O-acetyl-ADP-ribose deacetylase (regulator of RNase III)